MEKENNFVSYFVLEGIMTHLTLIIKRLIITLIVVLALWAGTIAGFLIYLSLPVEEYTETTIDQSIDNESNNNTLIGVDNNGKTESR